MPTLETVKNNDFVVTFPLGITSAPEFQDARTPAQECQVLTSTPQPQHPHHRYLQWAAPQPSLTGPDPTAQTLPAGHASEFLLWTKPKQNRGTCGSLRSASSPLPHPPSPGPHAPVRTPAGEGSPAVCFAQPPPLARPLPGDRPKSPFPDRLCCLPVPTNRSPSGGRSGLESCRDKHCLGCSQDLLALSQGC